MLNINKTATCEGSLKVTLNEVNLDMLIGIKFFLSVIILFGYINVKLGISLASCIVPVTSLFVIVRKLMGNVCDTVFLRNQE